MTETLKAEFSHYLDVMSGQYRYSATKFRHLLHDNWPEIKRIIRGEIVVQAPSFVEIHVAEPCNLNCIFCRGQLRDVPQLQSMMNHESLIRLIDGIHSLNAGTFIRFSGLIGEPLLHPDIVDVFDRVNQYESLSWGLSTNGVFLDKPGVLGALMKAKYAHVSIDAGSDATYRRLKQGRPGDFERVLDHVGALVHTKSKCDSRVSVVVSFLMQSENFHEIPILSKRLQELCVNVFEIKMQHFDERRGMTNDEVKKAFDLIEQARRKHETPDYRILTVQSYEEAVGKIDKVSKPIAFSKCYANQLGLNTTIDPAGNIQSCCQYYQGTLGIQGSIEHGIEDVWFGRKRREILERDPHDHCVNCSPSDQFVNTFVEFLRRAYLADPAFISWVEEQVQTMSAD